MRTIIMADGRSMRWYAQWQNEVWGINKLKQLVEVNGEPILHRTVRLLRAQEVYDIWITSHNPAHEVPHTTRYEPPNNEYEIDKFYSPIHLWSKEEDGETLFVYGDVWFSDQAMFTIVNTQVDDVLFFGRFHQSYYTEHGGEIFAIKVKDHNFFKYSCEYIRNKHIAGECRSGAWELYRYMNGASDAALGMYVPYGRFIGIDDFTDDFDTPEHFKNWLERYNAW